MIWESAYWKNDLLKLSKKIAGRMTQTRWTDASNANAEKEIMIAAFIARKLFESKKISEKLESHRIKIVKYESNGKKINLMSRLSPERYFDIETPIKDSITFKVLSNQIIHSYIFMLIMNEHHTLTHFLVASDFDKFKFMYMIEVKSYSTHLKKIGSYWPRSEQYSFDENKGDYVVKHD